MNPSNPQKYVVNSPDIIYELIDNEVIIVNLEKGHYYSLLGTGTDIWSGILAGESLEQIATELANVYTTDHQEVLKAVQSFTQRLTEENILRAASPDDIENSEPWHLNHKEDTDGIFVPPSFERFTDLEELLLLDPVHDVDELGWPSNNLENRE